MRDTGRPDASANRQEGERGGEAQREGGRERGSGRTSFHLPGIEEGGVLAGPVLWNVCVEHGKQGREGESM